MQSPPNPAKPILLIAVALGIMGALAYLVLAPVAPDEGVIDAAPVAALAPPQATTQAEAPIVEVPPEPEPQWPHPGDATASFERVVAECPQVVIGMGFNDRVVAIDASPAQLDMLVEYTSKPNRYVRLSCRWLGAAWADVVVGRQSIPALVGDADRFPAEMLPTKGYDVAWYRERIAAARGVVGESAQVERVETSHVASGAALTRVRFDGGRTVILAADAAVLPDDTPFPQVERVRFVAPKERELGFRDMQRIDWGTALASRLDQIAAKYVAVDEPLFKLHFTTDYAVITVQRPDFPGQYRDKTIDEYGELEVGEAHLWGSECKKSFTIAQARALLDGAIAERRQTRAQFDETRFDAVNFDCRDGKGPVFQFTERQPEE